MNQMRIAMALTVLNIVIWGAFIAFLPGSHFALPGAYRFWWFDDVPWAFLIFAVIALCLLKISPLGSAKVFSRVLIALLAIALATTLPYVALSGGGV
jgi:uncharacterized ion transporter superfamily protein YfcC